MMIDGNPMTFAEMAVELRCAASREAFSIGALEVFEARYPNDLKTGTLDQVRRTATAFGEMHALMRALSPYEAEVRALLTKGSSGGTLFFRCDDAYKTHAELKEKGVDLPEEPEDRGYGIDFGLRDPFGNNIRIASMKQG